LTETRHGGGTKFTKFTKNTKKTIWFDVSFFVIFGVLVIFVPAAVGRLSVPQAARSALR
jgi:hypothetical protein